MHVRFKQNDQEGKDMTTSVIQWQRLVGHRYTVGLFQWIDVGSRQFDED